MITSTRFRRSILIGLFVVGLLLRVLFLLYGAVAYYGNQPSIHFNGDSYSYMWSFENLYHSGNFTFDYLMPDAYFGRLPGYPLFYGLHYMLFGPQLAPAAVSWTQLLLDSSGILLLFGIVRRALPQAVTAPLVAAALYAFYPFIIIWIPIIGTESLSTILTLAWLYCLLRFRFNITYFFGVGILIALAFYVREYLGVLLPITMVHFAWIQYRAASDIPASRGVVRAIWQSIVVVGLGFGILYVGWPIRNYVLHNSLVLVKPKTAGYATFGPELNEFRSWLQCWTNDENPWIEKIRSSPSVEFPSEVFANVQEKIAAQRLVALAKRCGTSYFLVNNGLFPPNPIYRDTTAMQHHAAYQAMKRDNCDAQIGNGFIRLRKSYMQRHPIAYWLNVPLQNLKKAFFKSGTSKTENEPITGRVLLLRALFGYRTLLLVLGLAGLLAFRHCIRFLPIALFFGFMYLFISFLYRGLEMRYLLQADVVLLVPAACLIGHFFDRLLIKSTEVV